MRRNSEPAYVWMAYQRFRCIVESLAEEEPEDLLEDDVHEAEVDPQHHREEDDEHGQAHHLLPGRPAHPADLGPHGCHVVSDPR